MNRHRFIAMPIEAIWQAVKHELDNAVFTVGTCMFEQIHGIFMGGMSSAILMIMFCAWHEQQVHTLFRAPHIHIDGCREMDDGVAIIALDASSCDTQSTLSTILSTLDTHLYTAPSHATFDPSIDHFNMLECTITYHNSQLTVTHWSKNFTHAYLTHAQRYLKGTPAHSHGYRPLTHITNNFTRILTNTLHTPSHHIHIAASILKMAYESHPCMPRGAQDHHH
jgi:hypothetical protein